MATVYGIEVAGETYDIEDTNAREGVQTNANDIDGIEGKIPSSASDSNQLIDKQTFSNAKEIDAENLTMLSGYSSSEASLVNHAKCGSVECAIMRFRNIAGNGIGTMGTVNVCSSSLRPKRNTSLFLYDYINKAIIRCIVLTTGIIQFAESGGTVPGNNDMYGEVIFLS